MNDYILFYYLAKKLIFGYLISLMMLCCKVCSIRNSD